MYRCRADFPFSLKCLFKDNPLLLILILFSASSLITAYAVYLAERNPNPLLCDIDTVCSFGNAVWLVLMTVTTVGLGDYYPQTHLGRLIIFFIAIWGTLMISLTVVVVANTLKMEKK
jgi:voltage-gated potassium channel